MLLLLLSFTAGVLTVLAPCTLPLLPIIIGGSAGGTSKRSPYIITLALAGGIVLFTLLLKFSTLFINIPQNVWSIISGSIIIILGITNVFPVLWEKINIGLGLGSRSSQLLSESAAHKNRWGDILIGLSLGPVFSSCSPTYFLILATVLPRSLAVGTLYLVAYALGLALILLLVSILGRRFTARAAWATDPKGWFKRGLGVVFIIIGLVIFTGTDKKIQTYLVQNNYYPGGSLEQSLIERFNNTSLEPQADTASATTMPTDMTKNFPRYREITNPAGYVNTPPVKLADLIGKKVILVDFMTYSCINCIRTFPYLNAWYDKYKDDGLEIVGIHTPEFAFEHKQANVEKALAEFGIKFPVVLDNDYGTWNAYGNNYWPRKYLIDIDGYIVYDHIGEGNYDETEAKIQELLQEKMLRDHATTTLETSLVTIPARTPNRVASPETYFGADRNRNFANGDAGKLGTQTITGNVTGKLNDLNLLGTWNFNREYTEASAGATISYRYSAAHVFFVGSATKAVRVEVLEDGKPLPQDAAGKDIEYINGKSYVTVQEDRLYELVKNLGSEEHTLELKIEGGGLKAYTFTFG